MIENALKTYKCDEEETHRRDILSLIETAPDCFYRTHFNPGHITGSALLVSADNRRVLMNHHKFLNIWICFGGHADGERDVLDVAMREAREESGIENIEPVTADIFSVDIHPIPENPKKGEPPHRHFDIRYLLRVKDKADEAFAMSEESHNLRWCGYEEARVLAANDLSMHRLLIKWNEGKSA